MLISNKAWIEYISKKHDIDKKAIEVAQKWLDANPTATEEELVRELHAIISRYGQASGALACEMYEALAEAQGVAIESAEMAEPPNQPTVRSDIHDTIKLKQKLAYMVGQEVKQIGEDTILQNAARDGAEFAWIPSGDSCAFCIVLASRGWQHMSKEARKGIHADHIHSNCDCSYMVRFDGKSSVEGYDPKTYEDMYYSYGNTSKQRIKSLRREHYEKNKDYINAQKRAAYAARKKNDSSS